MKTPSKILVFLALLLIFSSCNKRINTTEDDNVTSTERINIPNFGDSTSLELMTWNVRNFPLLEDRTVVNIAEIISDLNVDIVGFQEIEDTLQFRHLLELMPTYDGLYSQDIYSGGSYQKTAVVFKKDLVQISQVDMLFTNDSYSFPRPPLKVYIRATFDSGIVDFTLIVLHLKAFGGLENEARRKSACQKLKSYLDLEILNSQDKDFIVIGDWNDSLTDPVAENVFQIFLNDSLNYTFLTRNIAQNPGANATYIGSFQSVIDHILISNDVLAEYENGSTQVIKLDTFFPPYENEVSDHRPVGALFPVF